MAQLRELKDAYKNDRCFIVATGPSLAYKDLSFLKNETVIALNLAPLFLDIFNVVPTFNIIADKFQYPKFREIFKQLTYNKAIQKIIVASACDTFPEDLKDENTQLFPIKLQQKKASFSQDPTEEGFSRGKTVAYDAIQLAYYLGFKEVYIIGMDMNVNLDWGKNGHCYEIQTNPKFKDIEFFKKDDFEIQRGLPGHPEYASLINKCMKLANKKFNNSGRKIFNDSRSNADFFVKKDILKEFGNIKKVIAFVPAKGTSTRVPSKNIRKLGNKPLFLHILDTLIKCDTIDEVYLDSESEEVFNLAKDRKVKFLKRDISLANNQTDGNQLLLNEASKVDGDIYVQALPTAPFLSEKSINKAIFNLIISKENDSVFTVTRNKLYLWNNDGKPANYDPLHIPNSVNLNETIIETMGFYAIKKEALMIRKSRIGQKPLLWDIPHIEATDIDTIEDFEFAERLIQGRKNE
ncbi:MAG: 6-hydroxymethylpterin diphosphokinase MptE-like protein [Nanoarchaeota archaeon]